MNDEVALRKNIGKKIKLARAKSNYTQEKLAEKTSLSSRYISQLERGLAFGSASTIINICKALNINSDFLFSDLINSDCPSLDNLVDNNFLESYIKLDDRNKRIIQLLTDQLIKVQNEEKFKKRI
jgi:transcriptional regulator with XRE-family HTH domain